VLMASREVPSVRIGSCRRVPVDGLRRYVAGLARKGAKGCLRGAAYSGTGPTAVVELTYGPISGVRSTTVTNASAVVGHPCELVTRLALRARLTKSSVPPPRRAER
jgi:hypothetical protein